MARHRHAGGADGRSRGTRRLPTSTTTRASSASCTGAASRSATSSSTTRCTSPSASPALIMPWNAPLMLSTWRIAPALAAGNTVVLKPAEWSPLTSTALARVLEEAELPPGVFNVVQGFGETAGAPLSAHPGVDLIVFTGETATGRLIMAAGRADAQAALDGAGRQVAGRRLRRTPTPSSRSTPRSRRSSRSTGSAARRARGCWSSAGSTTGSSTRSPSGRAHIRVGDPSDPRTELGPLIHPEHHARVLGYIESARARGRAACSPAASARRALTRGNFLRGDRDRRRRRVDDASSRRRSSARCSSRRRSRTRPRRCAWRTRRQYGLAAYVWTNDVRRAHRVAEAIDTGMCWINSQNVRDLRTPFGGTQAVGDRPRGRRLRVRVLLRHRDRPRRARQPRIPRFGLAG